MLDAKKVPPMIPPGKYLLKLYFVEDNRILAGYDVDGIIKF